MPAVAVTGDAATTTTLALAAVWPAGEPVGRGDVARSGADADGAGDRPRPPIAEPIVVEADPSGGSLAAWLDVPLLPSLSSVVAAVGRDGFGESDPGAVAEIVEPLVRRTDGGLRFVPAPFRSREARRTVSEAGRLAFPALVAVERSVVLFDTGRLDAWSPPAAARNADLVLVTHRQEAASPGAASVRLERTGEAIEELVRNGHRVALAVIGDVPFDLDEIRRFLGDDLPARGLADDPVAAAVLAGRGGMSTRRLHRLPLLRSAAQLAADLARPFVC